MAQVHVVVDSTASDCCHVLSASVPDCYLDCLVDTNLRITKTPVVGVFKLNRANEKEALEVFHSILCSAPLMRCLLPDLE